MSFDFDRHAAKQRVLRRLVETLRRDFYVDDDPRTDTRLTGPRCALRLAGVCEGQLQEPVNLDALAAAILDEVSP